MVDFTQALDIKADAIEKPPVAPQGTYIWAVTKVPTPTVSKSGEWSVLEFPIRGVSAEEDVDVDDLEAFGAPSAMMNRVTFMAPTAEGAEFDAQRKAALWRIKRFILDVLQADVEESATFRELLNASLNCQFFGQAVWRPSDDGEETYIDVKNYSALD